MPGDKIRGRFGGRAKGTPNKVTTEVRDLARNLVEDSEYRDALIVRLRAGLAGNMEQLLWYYAYGKPKETVELSGDVTVNKVVLEIIDTSDTPIVDSLPAETIEEPLLLEQVYEDDEGP